MNYEIRDTLILLRNVYAKFGIHWVKKSYCLIQILTTFSSLLGKVVQKSSEKIQSYTNPRL